MNKPPRFFFRVDRSPLIGLGHWARCQLLAGALRAQGADVDFDEVSSSPDAFLTSIIAKGAQRRDWLVLDSYCLDEQWEIRARAAGFRVLTIDDSPKRKYSADVLLDPNLSESGGERWLGSVASHTRVWAGADYLLLRAEFFEAGAARRGLTRAPQILVSMGGADPPGMALRVVQALTFLKGQAPGLALPENMALLPADWQGFRTTVLGGALNIRSSELQALVVGLPDAEYLSSSSSIAQLMAQADLCIGAGGGTIWERAYMELPSLVVTLAENQRDAVDHFQRKGAHVALGWHEDLEPHGLARSIANALADPSGLGAMAAKAKALVGEPGFVRDPLGYLLGV
jgi:UDP-2,4-diacetamido-2,4,6-trideoxy-beta-L-altropyranose hydrolase